MSVGILIILTSLITVMPAVNAQSPNSGINFGPDTATLIQGKVASNGVLFFVLDKQPLTNNYNIIQSNTVLHDPNMEIYIYNPNHNTTLKFTVEEYQLNQSGLPEHITYQNKTFLAPTDQITQEFTTIQLSPEEEYIDIGINGTFYSCTEQYITTPAIPFYAQGEIAYLAFIMVMSGIAIIIAFTSALALLKKAKYFPPIRAIYIIIIGIFTAIAGESILTTNYYEIIQTRWEYYFIPLYAFFLLLFLSNIPTKIQKGLLLRFMNDRGNNEIRTQYMVIHTAEMDLLELENMRHSGMEYISNRSYTDFLKRLIGIHIPIYFSQGELPSEIEKPERITKKGIKFHLKNTFKFRNMKREPNDFDFGYLLDAQANPEITTIKKNEITNEIQEITTPETQQNQQKKKRELFKKIKNYKILHIPISGHHSKLMEQFLAGLNETELKGKRIDELTLQNAQLQAEIEAKTYFSKTDIIREMSKQMNSQPRETKTEVTNYGRNKEGNTNQQ